MSISLDDERIVKFSILIEEASRSTVEGVKFFIEPASGVLAPRAGTHISQLPKGLKAYIYANPESYQDYLEERRAELDYLRAMGRNAREAEREGKFGKRVRGEGERIFGSAECDSEC